MKDYLKNSHIFNTLGIEKIRSKLYGNFFIGYDSKNNEVIIDDTNYTRIKIGILTFILLCLGVKPAYNLLTLTDNTLSERFIFVMVIMCYAAVTYMWFHSNTMRKLFYEIIFYLEVIDDLLSKQYDYSKTKRRINYLIRLYLFANISPCIVGVIPILAIYFFIPKGEYMAYVAIVLHFLAPSFIYNTTLRYFLNDRLNIFNQIVINSQTNCTTEIECRECSNDETNNRNLCYKHTIANFETTYKIFIRLLNSFEELDYIIVGMTGIIVLITGPHHMYNVKVQINKENTGLTFINNIQYDFIGTLMAIHSTMNVFNTVATITAHKNIARSMHKFYLHAQKHVDVEPLLIQMSMCVLVPKYSQAYLAGTFLLSVDSLAQLYSTCLSMSAFLSCFPI